MFQSGKKHAGFLSRTLKAEGCTFSVLNRMPLPCFLLHSPFIRHSYRSIVLLSTNRLGQTTLSPVAYRPPSWPVPRQLDFYFTMSNRPLTLSLIVHEEGNQFYKSSPENFQINIIPIFPRDGPTNMTR